MAARCSGLERKLTWHVAVLMRVSHVNAPQGQRTGLRYPSRSHQRTRQSGRREWCSQSRGLHSKGQPRVSVAARAYAILHASFINNRHGQQAQGHRIEDASCTGQEAEQERAAEGQGVRKYEISDDMHAHKDPHSPSHLARSGPYQEMPADLTALLCTAQGGGLR